MDAIFTGEIELVSPNNVKRIGNEAITCASGGMSIMFRKDTSMAWFSEGVLKMMANGDYQWICNMSKHIHEPFKRWNTFVKNMGSNFFFNLKSP